MAIEKERKFRLTEVPAWVLNHINSKKIQQAYLMLDKTKQLRVRITTEDGYEKKAHLCYKSDTGNPEIRNEYELEMLVDEAQELYDSSEIKLEKTRYSFPSLDTEYPIEIDIDVYPSGLIIMEIEYSHSNLSSDLTTQPYILEEVTGVYQYSNINLAQNG